MIKTWFCNLFRGAVFAALTAGLSLSAAAQDTKRSITQIKGDVYRFQNNFHFAMFVVTDDGIVVTDPINADAVTWLKAELAKRFDKPVTHMILSHFHGDHASGGEAWGSLEVVAHEKTKAHIAAGKTKTALPTVTFSDTYRFSAGGKDFELTYLGKGHSDDLIAVVVRPENVAFVVDAVSPRRLIYRDFGGSDVAGMIAQIKVIEGLDYEVLLPGHSVVGTKQDATDMRIYVETLRDQVLAKLKSGMSEEDIVASDVIADYKDWGAYEQWRPLNIKGMVRWLKETGRAG